jgi:GT2 family glycosyltransferase
VSYTSLEEMHQFAYEYTRQHAGESFEISMLTMFCMAMRRDVMEKIGKLDERFGMGMFEDDDYAMRIRMAGYRIFCMEDVFIHHFGSVSFRSYGDDIYQKVLEENRKKFEEKWGISWQPHGFRKN